MSKAVKKDEVKSDVKKTPPKQAAPKADAQVKVDTAEAEKIRERIKSRVTGIQEGFWDLSVDLHTVWQGALYTLWGHGSFNDYAENELGYKPRSAAYLVTIQDYFGKLSPDIQSWVKGLGWSKAKELVGHIDEANWKSMRDALDGKSVTQIIAFLKGGSKGKAEKSSGSEAEAETTQRKAFALFPAQAANVDKALSLAKEQANTDKDGHALDLICTSFLAQGGGDVSEILARLEKTSGLRFVAFDPAADAVVFGEDLLTEMGGDEAEEEVA